MIYLYLFGTCFHFIYVFMIIWKITLKVQNNYELRSLLRSFGAQIEVIAPESLRQMMKETAETVSQIYEK